MDKKELHAYIGKQIRKLRKRNNWTLHQLAAKVGVGHSSIANYEKGYRSPKHDTLVLLADTFGISIDDFFPQVLDNRDCEAISKVDERPLEQSDEHVKKTIKLGVNTNRMLGEINAVYGALQESRQEKVYSYVQKQLEQQDNLPEPEQDLLDLFGKLNDEGQRKLQEHAELLVASRAYVKGKKTDSEQFGEFSQELA